MSCCGDKRAALRQEFPAGGRGESRFWISGDIEFEYSGPGQLTVLGPITGTTYRFASPGARVRVNGSDAPSFISIPRLKAVR